MRLELTTLCLQSIRSCHLSYNPKIVELKGLEPSTLALKVQCSDQLSYRTFYRGQCWNRTSVKLFCRQPPNHSTNCPMENMLLCRIEFHTAMEMRHDCKIIAFCCWSSVCVKLIGYRVMESLFMCANSDNTVITDTLEVFTVTTYRLLVKLYVILRNLIFLRLCRNLSSLFLTRFIIPIPIFAFVSLFYSCRDWNRTSDLQVMSLASYRCSTLRCYYVYE